jgi:NAD+ diphosphatase
MIQDIFPHQFGNTFKPNAQLHDNDYIFHYKDNTLLLKTDGDVYALPQKKDFQTITEANAVFLFTLNHLNCFWVTGDVKMNACNFEYHELNFFRSLKQKEIAWVGPVGHQLKTWYEQNRFCGKCGTKNDFKEDERAMICPDCKHVTYPKISPAIIVAIRSGNKILMVKGSSSRIKYYALVAGYAEIGESLEQTVVREVKEEVGLDVTNIRYYKSQPWPFSGCMMVGFTAEADENQPFKLDPNEIAEAHWYTKDNMPEHSPNISIGGELIEQFIKGNI